jgi:probable rRNA maturation factor
MTAEPSIFDRQDRYAVNSSRLKDFIHALGKALHLGGRVYNVCLVDDREIKRLNSLYRGQWRATDVLSFPWNPGAAPAGAGAGSRTSPGRRAGQRRRQTEAGEFKDFLGDIVISAQTAQRNAQLEGHPTLNEIRWLILHGLLHLLGYDHERDAGEMTSLEISLRQRLGVG